MYAVAGDHRLDGPDLRQREKDRLAASQRPVLLQVLVRGRKDRGLARRNRFIEEF